MHSQTVVKHISAMLKADDSFDSAVNAVSETDGDACVCEGRLLLSNEACKSPNAPSNLSSLQTPW